jgi:vacuolar-type H+-ATPase subunit B/Vma2
VTENRNIETTTSNGWRLLSMLPQEELTPRLSQELDQYYKAAHG